VDRWLNVQLVSREEAGNAVVLMGALIAVRLLVGVHRGVITGAQRIAWLSGVGSAAATLRGAGVVPILWLHPGIEAFFAFQLAVTVLEAAAMAWQAWRLLPSAEPARSSLAALRSVRDFSGVMVLIALLYVVLTQVDKVLLSAWVPLGEFGRYALAASVAGVLSLLVAPVATVAYPRLNQLHARGEALAGEVHGFAAIVALAVAPAAAVMALFARPLLEAWTRDPEISAAAAPLLGWLAFGSLLHAFTTVPYLLPLVRGKPSTVAATYFGLVVLAVPVLAFAIDARGALGAAQGWAALCLPGFALCWPLMAGSLTSGQRGRWLLRDVLAPTAAALSVAAATRAILGDASPAAGVAAAALAYALALGAAALCLPYARGFIGRFVRPGSGAAVEVQEEKEVG
jgi:O-antigen/teichoic acid export membrane protein